MSRLGVVSFLNARPLVPDLGPRDGVELEYDVPARLAERLERNEVDAALLPIVDVIARPDALRVISDACIACDGETMTVRIFSQVPPDRIVRVHADTDSHTSVALARVLWRLLYDRVLEVVPFNAYRGSAGEHEAVLLIGDKVVDSRRGSFAYEIDLGGAWRQQTGLPFVFAVWAANDRLADEESRRLSDLLGAARDRGVAQAVDIARREGPPLGWPEPLAIRYLTRCLRFQLDARAVHGANRFAQLAAEFDVVDQAVKIPWPALLLEDKVV